MDHLKLMRWFAANYGVSELSRDETAGIPVTGAGFAMEYVVYRQPDNIKLTLSTEKFSQLIEQLYQLEHEAQERKHNSAVADAYNKYQVLLELCK